MQRYLSGKLELQCVLHDCCKEASRALPHVRADPAKLRIRGFRSGEGAFCRRYTPPQARCDGLGDEREDTGADLLSHHLGEKSWDLTLSKVRSYKSFCKHPGGMELMEIAVGLSALY